VTTFTDDFNRADGSPGANWVQVSGTWSIISNQLSSGSAGGTIILRAATAMATNDNSAQVTIAATAAVSQGVWCRGNTTLTQGYLWRNDGSSWNLFYVVGGSFVSIGTFAGAAVAGDVAKVQAVGSTIKGFVNGVQRVSVTDTNVATGTSVGIRAESVSSLRFDNFTGTDVTTGSTGDAALSGIATLSAAGIRATAGSASLNATATLTSAGVRGTAGNAALASTASLTADGVRGASSGAALTAAATLTADGLRAAAGAASLSSTASLSATGMRGTSGAASLAVSATLSASGAVTSGQNGNATLGATAALSAAGTVAHHFDAVLAASAALQAAGVVATASGGSLMITAALQASGQVAGTVSRGVARGAAGSAPGARRGDSAAGPRAQHGTPAPPTARGGLQ
jgi:hypothetical protein